MTRENIAEILQIDGEWLPGIREYNYRLEDIDSEDSNRSEGGYMHRNVLRASVYNATVTHMVTLEEMTQICEAVKAETTIPVNALCPGKESGGAYAEMDVYVSKLDVQLVLYKPPEGETEESWWQVNYTLVEV